VTLVSRVADVNGVPVSALVAEAPRPRAVIVALHGGAVTSRYFDVPDWPRLSLLRTGAALGFTVIALDRPGYGRSAPYPDRITTVAQRVALTYGAVDRLLAARPRGAGVFLLGHSQGCVLAVQMAAGERGPDLLGLEIAGTGRAYQAGAAVVLEARAAAVLASRGAAHVPGQVPGQRPGQGPGQRLGRAPGAGGG
jgi:pimeloyl-ACP methyl ester carboxylesterase